MSRILHMMNGLEIGGRERVVLDLIKKARREGCDHRLLLFDSVFRNDRLDFPPGDIPICFEKRRPGFDWTLPGRVARHLERGACDALHAHNDTAVFYGALAVIHPRRAGAALIATFHTMPAAATRAGKALTNLATRWATHLTAVSPEMGRRLAAEGWVSRQPTIIWNGIDLEEFSLGGQTAKSLTIGHIGRFSRVKRQRDLLEAYRMLPAGNCPTELVFVGQGETLGEVQKAASGCEGVKVVPNSHEIARFLHEIDIFVICSEHEGAPRALLEAMACGRAIVATAVGGMPEMLTDADGTVCGRLVPPRRPDLLAQAIAELAGSVEVRRSLGAAARSRAMAFSAERQWSEYARLYASLAD